MKGIYKFWYISSYGLKLVPKSKTFFNLQNFETWYGEQINRAEINIICGEFVNSNAFVP